MPDHGYVAMDTHLHVYGVPGGDRPPDSQAQNGEKGKDKEEALHGIKPHSTRVTRRPSTGSDQSRVKGLLQRQRAARLSGGTREGVPITTRYFYISGFLA
jgi:hypothetical protein